MQPPKLTFITVFWIWAPYWCHVQQTARGDQKIYLKDQDKGWLPRNHPAILFLLADICHWVRTFGTALWALLKRGKKTSEISLVDCLLLKRNYAWWLFSGRKLTYDKFKRTSKSPVLHHFNDHSTCGSWCKHTKKCEDELKTLKNTEAKKQMQDFTFCAPKL